MRHKRGLGSIRKLPSGKYQVRFTDPDGIRRSARTTFKSKATAELELTKIQRAIELGNWRVTDAQSDGAIDPNTLRLRELAELWRSQQVTSKGLPLSPNTLAEYKRLIERTLARFAERPIKEISRQQIESWRTPELKRAPNQTVKAYKHLKTLMSFASERNWITVNPCTIARGTAYTPSEPPAPTFDQVQAMIQHSTGFFKIVLVLAGFGGLRKGEILELRRKDIEEVLVNGETWVKVHVSRGVVWDGVKPIVRGPKSSAGIRSLFLPEAAGGILLEYLTQVPSGEEALLFSRECDGRTHLGEYDLNPSWRKSRSIAEFRGRFHSLRAFAATEFAKANPTAAELMERFGHKDIKTAMRYQRTTDRELELLKRMVGV